MTCKATTLALVAALGVAGCAALGEKPLLNNPVTKDRVVVIKEGFAIAKLGAATYRDLCADRIIPPDCRVVVPRLVAANAKANIALKKVESLQRLGPTVELNEAIDVLSDLVNEFKILIPETKR